jgi:Na+-transporting NADH:ubiquinone oxidoreductase subunit C
VAFLLAFVYKALKPMQDANVALDVKKQILYSLNIRGLDGSEAEAKYAEVVKAETDVDGQKAYACLVDGEEIMVFALKGMGLWGGISGYIAIHGEDDPTVYGAYFNHESETAGLGAEIKDSQAWQEKFIGKKVFADGDVVLSVVKDVKDPATQVDCVTGATLTSNGVNDMIKQGLKVAAKCFLNTSHGDCCGTEKTDSCCNGNDEVKDCCKDAPNCSQKAKDCCKDVPNCSQKAKECCKDEKDCSQDAKDCCKKTETKAKEE